MGADGYIRIWNSKKVRDRWPNADDMFKRMPNHYQDELDGILYDHCYWGDNLCEYWDDPTDWYGRKDITESEMQVMRQFVEWLWKNGTQWGVWT